MTTTTGVPLLVIARVLDHAQTSAKVKILTMDRIDDARRSIKERKAKEVAVDIIVVVAAVRVPRLSDPVREKQG